MIDSKGKRSQLKSWATTTIGAVTDRSIDSSGPSGDSVFTYVDISSIDNRRKCIIEPKILPVNEAPSRAKQRLKRDDTVVSMTRPNLNAVAFVRPELDGSIGSTGLQVLRPLQINPGWLYYLVQTTAFVEQMSSLVQGALYPAVRPKDILDYEMPLAPLPEQDRIVAEIEKQFTRLDAATGSLQQVRTKLDRYRASILKAACEGRLVPTEAELARAQKLDYERADHLLKRILADRRAKWEQEQLQKMRERGEEPKNDKWKTRYSEPSGPEGDQVPALPKGWAWTSVEQLTDSISGLVTGPFGTQISKEDHLPDGVPVVGIPNIREDGFEPGNWFHVSLSKAEQLRRYALRGGDVVVSRSGTVGGACVIPSGYELLLMSTNLMRIRTVEQHDIGHWVVLNFKGSPTIGSQIDALCKGSTRPFLNLEILGSLMIALAPTNEQGRILQEVDRLVSLISDARQAVEHNLRRAATLAARGRTPLISAATSSVERAGSTDRKSARKRNLTSDRLFRPSMRA